MVAPARPPAVLGTRLSGDGRSVVVEFDEPVVIDRLSVRRESGVPVAGHALEATGRELVIDLGSSLEGVDRLVLDGVVDRAGEPNPMPTTTLDIGPLSWPAVRDGLVFAWQTADASNLVTDAAGSQRTIALTPSGTALLDRFWAMQPGGGQFAADAEDAARVKASLQGSNEMTLELTLRSPRGPRTALVAAADNRRLNFRLERRRGRLVFQMKARSRGPDAQPAVELLTLPQKGPVHVVVTYSPASLVAWLDGEKVFEAGADVIRGDFYHWRNVPLVFGSGNTGDTRLEGVAIYDRVLEEDEVAAQYERYARQIAGRRSVEGAMVEARLVSTTPPPTLEQISPYREALVVSEYEVVTVQKGRLRAPRIRVAHWAILDGQRLALNDRPVGEIFSLSLQPFDANPQLGSLYLGQAGTIDAQLPLFYSAALEATAAVGGD